MAREEAHGPVPKGIHMSDNPPCVNVEHLRQGTHAENMSDMVSKGCSGQGVRANVRAVLTEADVPMIHDVYRSGAFTYHDLAERYRLHFTAIAKIVTGRTWRHVPMPREVV